jgi:hypothetical protein
MSKQKIKCISETGFISLHLLSLFLVMLAIFGFVGWRVMHHGNKPAPIIDTTRSLAEYCADKSIPKVYPNNCPIETKPTSNADNIGQLNKENPATSPSLSCDQLPAPSILSEFSVSSVVYKDWEDDELLNEKLRFKYPPSWTVERNSYQNNNATPGSDEYAISSPKGLHVYIQAAGRSDGGYFRPVIVEPIKILNGNYFISYNSMDDTNNTNKGIDEITLYSTIDKCEWRGPTTRNIKYKNAEASLVVGIGFDENYFSEQQTYKSLNQDSDFVVAKQIIASLSY